CDPVLAATIHERKVFSCTKAGSDRYFPDRREPIALRSPCCAQARGGHPWPPARRMRRAHGGCGQNIHVLHAPENTYLIQPSSSFSVVHEWFRLAFAAR